MITVKLSGGLGNQMFQYAAGRKLSIVKNEPLQLDLSWFSENKQGITKRVYLLDKFNINANIMPNLNQSTDKKLIKKIINKFIILINPYYHYQYHSNFLTKNNLTFGYFQSYKYFDDIQETITKDFSLRNSMTSPSVEIFNKIKSTPNSVAVHIRRGDYANDKNTNKYHGVLSLNYYNDAIKYFESKFNPINIFLFSDDIDWAKNNIKCNSTIIPVSKPEIPDFEEMYLMSCCQNQIIANSSFSWWSAWLNENDKKIIIAPRQWVASKNINLEDLIPSNWIKI